MIAGFAIGVVAECMKAQIPGRGFSTRNLIRDSFGVVVVVSFVEALTLIRLLVGWEESH